MATPIEMPTELLQRIQEHGYARIKIPSELQRTIDYSLATSQQFFRSSVKERLTGRLPGDLGYRGFEEEYSDSEERPDQVESFSASFRGLDSASQLLTGLPLVLYTRMLSAIALIESVAEAITLQLARDIIGSDPPFQVNGAFRKWSVLQVNFSWPSGVATDYINDLHEDGCFLTVATATAPGLEIRLPSGETTPVRAQDGELLIMPGEILWLVSGGAIEPLYHRVRPARSYPERASFLFFGDINPEYCQPWIVNEVNKSVDIGERVLKNPARFGLNEWEAQEGLTPASEVAG